MFEFECYLDAGYLDESSLKSKIGDFEYLQGFVEFRIPGNDYLNSGFPMMKKSLKRYMSLMLIANDEKLGRSEYYIRIMRLIRDLIPKSKKY